MLQEEANIDDNKILLKDFDLEQNEHFIKFVFIPYFKDIYIDLASKNDKKAKGINKVVFIEVTLNLFILIVREFAWNVE
jgi:hypothetical protein